ncbi:MAG: hypothetical protein K8W52_10835 [Deltaproteobacteria bacterium]|nr:hypothetical protein [Deltaproteobacteria bacterium]
MSRSLVLPALGAALVLASAPAHADIFSARAEIHGGGAGGVGIGGDQKDAAYFKNAPHGAYGALIGAQILIADAYIEHTQFTNGNRITTWTQFALGMRIDMKLGGGPALEKGGPARKPTGYFEFGIHAAFGLGTGQQVDPPLDNAQITDKGFLLEARVGFGKRLGHGLRLGVTIPVSGGYFFKSGNGATVNMLSTHYQGIEASALLTLGMQLGAL